MEQMTFLDFFAGIGGFRKGFELCGMRCVGHCEIDKYADRSYRAIHDVKEDEWYAADITKVAPQISPEQTCGQEDSRVRIFRSLAASEGLTEQEVDSLHLLNSSKAKVLKIDPHGLSLKMLRISYPFMEDGTLRPFSIRWPHSATISNTDCSIQSISAPSKSRASVHCRLPTSWSRTRTQNISCPRRQWQSSYPTHRWYAGQRVYDPAGISVTMAAQSGGWGGKTGLYFVDLCNGNPKLTDHARCIKAKYNSGITNRGGDNSGVLISPAGMDKDAVLSFVDICTGRRNSPEKPAASSPPITAPSVIGAAVPGCSMAAVLS